jgi:hypothetical protein
VGVGGCGWVWVCVRVNEDVAKLRQKSFSEFLGVTVEVRQRILAESEWAPNLQELKSLILQCSRIWLDAVQWPTLFKKRRETEYNKFRYHDQ